MKRFGFSSLLIIFIVAASINFSGCNQSNEEILGPVITFERLVLDITHANYIDKNIPAEINEDKIREIISLRKQKIHNMELLDKYDMKIISKNGCLACIVWDPKTNEKLIEDIRCTPEVDLKALGYKLYGNDFSLSWKKCEHNKN